MVERGQEPAGTPIAGPAGTPIAGPAGTPITGPAGTPITGPAVGPARLRLPAGLAEMPPGPALAATLAGIDRDRLNGFDLVTAAQARARQVAFEQAQLLADVVAIAHCPPGHADAPVARTVGLAPYAAEEVAAALTLTRRGGDGLLDLAFSVVERLPAVHAALAAGSIDQARARVLADGVELLDEPAARAVVDQVIGQAGELTTGQLRARLQRLVLSVDPGAARKRHAEAVTERRVETWLAGDGTACLTALGLPADRAAAAMERVSAIAKAAKASGDIRGLDQLRADTLLDLLDGTFTGPNPGPRRGVVELTVPLTTLMGLADEPVELAGWGPVLADIARRVATQQSEQQQWRYTVTDPTGDIVAHGRTSRRPTADTAAAVIARDRTCRAPGCRVPAHRCDLDHTLPWAGGGPTTADNLGALCRRHHTMKHRGGWLLRQLRPGIFAWITALGHLRIVTPRPP